MLPQKIRIYVGKGSSCQQICRTNFGRRKERLMRFNDRQFEPPSRPPTEDSSSSLNFSTKWRVQSQTLRKVMGQRMCFFLVFIFSFFFLFFVSIVLSTCTLLHQLFSISFILFVVAFYSFVLCRLLSLFSFFYKSLAFSNRVDHRLKSIKFQTCSTNGHKIERASVVKKFWLQIDEVSKLIEWWKNVSDQMTYWQLDKVTTKQTGRLNVSLFC